MPEFEIVTVDIDAMHIDDETRALLENAIPDEPVDWDAVLTEERIAQATLVLDLVDVH
jgi:hypothetical protein